MKSLVVICTLLIIPVCIMHSQTLEHSHFEWGFSLGQGWGVDLGYGRTSIDSLNIEYGIVFIGSVWIPYWGNNDPNGEEGYFDWFQPTTKTIQKVAGSLGVRYVYDKYSIGFMIDYIKNTTYQNYVSPVTGLDWHTAGVESNEFGMTFTSSYQVSQSFWLSIFIGNKRPIMFGLLMSM